MAQVNQGRNPPMFNNVASAACGFVLHAVAALQKGYSYDEYSDDKSKGESRTV
jgi:hypothetical protein